MEHLTGQVIGCAMAVHQELGSCFLESVYSKTLAVENSCQGIPNRVEAPLTVRYQQVVAGEFKADILVQDRLILELKAVQKNIAQHEVQLVNHLTVTGIDTGLLFNFGASSLRFKKKFRTYRSPDSKSSNPVKSC